MPGITEPNISKKNPTTDERGPEDLGRATRKSEGTGARAAESSAGVEDVRGDRARRREEDDREVIPGTGGLAKHPQQLMEWPGVYRDGDRPLRYIPSLTSRPATAQTAKKRRINPFKPGDREIDRREHRRKGTHAFHSKGRDEEQIGSNGRGTPNSKPPQDLHTPTPAYGRHPPPRGGGEVRPGQKGAEQGAGDRFSVDSRRVRSLQGEGNPPPLIPDHPAR
ncbi:hypothetical protein HNY73_014713 [Argiope bruennichi]|uniref:Uncharacterized protein n=1 Tax=Argiope bruennichi TaxID=94029 RepID=A0A8T0EPV9_ARGBR|nr:hypothetical protein HNY73_014713 [Argiope bruennichi]